MLSVKRFFTGSPFEAQIGYCRALVKGPWCFVSGVTGYDYASMTMPESAAAQAESALATITKVLAETGFVPADIVKVTYILTDATLLDEVAPVLSGKLGSAPPTATMIIAGLIRPEMKIEVEVIALKG